MLACAQTLAGSPCVILINQGHQLDDLPECAF